VLAGAILAVTVLSKPWIFASVMAALAVVVLASRGDRRLRGRLIVVAGTAAVVAAPLLYRTVTLFDDSQVTFRPAFFPIPLVMAERIGLREWFLERASALGLSGDGQVAIASLLAAPLFLAGSLGFRMAGLRELWRCLRRPGQHDPIWRVLAWTAVAALGASTVIASVPYHETTQIHQFALFVLVVFVGRRLGAWAPGGARTIATVLVIAVAVPCTLQYLHRKWNDRQRPLVEASQAEVLLAAQLRRTDPERTILLHDRPNDPTLLGILAERRSVIAWAGYVRGGQPRRDDVEAFFRGADMPRALEILRAYGPTHVVEYTDRDRIDPGVLARLDLVVRQGNVAVYRVPQSVR
jgi:hypothetical protein